MKKLLLFLLSLSLLTLHAQNNFITRWNLSLDPGSGADQIQFRAAIGTGGASYYWETIPSGSSGTGTLTDGNALRTITGIPAGAIIRLYIEPTRLERFYLNNGSDAPRLVDLEQWGTASWTSMADAFMGCSNLDISATDIPNLTVVTNLRRMFMFCESLTGPANIGSWETGLVTNMFGMFASAGNFDQNIGSWNTKDVNFMQNMFDGASSFNQDLGNWVLKSSVTLTNMFDNSGMDCENYANTLVGWDQNNPSVTGRTLGAVGLEYGMSAVAARENLITAKSWTIIGDASGCPDPGNFVTIWDLSLDPGSGPDQIQFNAAIASGGGIYTWQELPSGATGSGTLASGDFLRTISNLPASTIRLGIAPDKLQRFYIFGGPDRQRLLDVEQWGAANWTSMEQAFNGCTNLDVSAQGLPDLSGVTSLTQMFRNCSSLTGPDNIGDWNVANITSLLAMFFGASFFNQDISIWNTANVTSMTEIFAFATSFNQNLAAWSLNSVLALNNMLNSSGMDCMNYSSTLIGWNNNPTTPDNLSLGAFGMQYGTNAEAARDDLINVKGWTILGDLPSGTDCSPPPFITRWDLSLDPGSGANQIQFNATIAPGGAEYAWETVPPGSAGSGTLASGMSMRTITGIPANAIIRLSIAPNKLRRFTAGFSDNDRLIDVEQWGIVQWSRMDNAFQACANLNITATDIPDLSQATTMAYMFVGCSSLNGPVNIGDWNTETIINMTGVFKDAILFNQDMGSWNTSSVTTMQYMFENAQAFNQDIGSWNTENVLNMASVFESAHAFNQDISAWSTAEVITMQRMFWNAHSFNQDIGNWDVGNVTNFNSTFAAALAFNQNLGNWNMQSVSAVGSMLNGSNLNCENYSSTLIGWSSQPALADNLSFGSTGLQYGTNAILARNNLIENKGWSFFGDSFSGENCSPPGVVADDQVIQSVNMQNGDSFCYDATQTITVTNFTVENGASAVLIAGQSITLGPDFVVEPGGNLHASITLTQDFCNGAQQPSSTEITDESFVSEPENTIAFNEGSSIRLYPNPTTGRFSLEFSEIISSATVEIYGFMGERVLRYELSDSQLYELDLSGHVHGMYLILVNNGDKIWVEKLIRQ
jgi:surface protein